MQAIAYQDSTRAETAGPARTLGAAKASAEQTAQRGLNIVVATAAIVLTAPVMVAAALAVRLTSSGPAIFKQHRVGFCQRRRSDRRGSVSQPDGGSRKGMDRRNSDTGGEVFTIYKFRTMTVSDQPKEEWATPDDPRITPVGRFLRRTRIDELPQLFNVLKGDMNIVGPRPEQPGIFAELRGQVDRYADRQKVRPGITGLAQVNLGYDQSLEDVRRKVRMDLYYVQSQGIKKDLEIMTRTVPVMLFKKGSI